MDPAGYSAALIHEILCRSDSAARPNRARIIPMLSIAIIAMKLLEAMFFVGLVGSTIVVLISFVEDAKELFGED